MAVREKERSETEAGAEGPREDALLQRVRFVTAVAHVLAAAAAAARKMNFPPPHCLPATSASRAHRTQQLAIGDLKLSLSLRTTSSGKKTHTLYCRPKVSDINPWLVAWGVTHPRRSK
jgi:hypothetical protein